MEKKAKRRKVKQELFLLQSSKQLQRFHLRQKFAAKDLKELIKILTIMKIVAAVADVAVKGAADRIAKSGPNRI